MKKAALLVMFIAPILAGVGQDSPAYADSTTIVCTSVNLAFVSDDIAPGKVEISLNRKFASDAWQSLPQEKQQLIANCFAQPAGFAGRFFKIPVPFIKGLKPNESKVKVDLEACWPSKTGTSGVLFSYHKSTLPSFGNTAPGIFQSGSCKR